MSFRGGSLRIDVMIAPHHGGNNGSSRCFIEATTPTHVIFSAGHQHDHPADVTAQRYIDFGIVPVANMLGRTSAMMKAGLSGITVGKMAAGIHLRTMMWISLFAIVGRWRLGTGWCRMRANGTTVRGTTAICPPLPLAHDGFKWPLSSKLACRFDIRYIERSRSLSVSITGAAEEKISG